MHVPSQTVLHVLLRADGYTLRWVESEWADMVASADQGLSVMYMVRMINTFTVLVLDILTLWLVEQLAC